MLEGLKRRWGRLSAKTHVAGLTVLAITAFMLIWDLNGWTSGMNNEEAGALAANNGHALISDPINFPVRLLQLLFNNIGWHSLLAMRLATVMASLILVMLYYKAGKLIFGRHAAVTGTLLLVATPWFLIASRQASAFSLLLFPVALVYILLLIRSDQSRLKWLLFCVLISVSLYIPGMVWVSLALLWVFRRTLVEAKRNLSAANFSLGILISMALLGPLSYALIKNWSLGRQLILLPDHFGSVQTIIKQVGWALAGLFWRTGQHFSLTIGRLPMLSALQIILMVFGLYATRQKVRRLFYAALALIFYAVVASGLNNNPVYLLIALPPIALFMKAGLRYLYLEWRGIFPRNPIPQMLAVILIALVTVAQLWLAWRYTYDAWPHTPETKAAYVIK